MYQLKSDYRKDISANKNIEQRLNKQVLKEQHKLDEALDKIEKYILSNVQLDIEQLVDNIIYRSWVTKDKLTKQQLYESTKALVIDILTEVTIEDDSVEAIDQG